MFRSRPADLSPPEFREAEIENFDDAVRCDFDVRGLQVAMDDAALVRGVQGIGDLSRDRERVSERQRTLRDPFRQRLALDELEHECGAAIDVLEAINRADVGMIQRRQHARFALEAREALRIGREDVRQDFDRDVATELLIMGAIDLAHAANAEE